MCCGHPPEVNHYSVPSKILSLSDVDDRVGRVDGGDEWGEHHESGLPVLFLPYKHLFLLEVPSKGDQFVLPAVHVASTPIQLRSVKLAVVNCLIRARVLTRGSLRVPRG